MTEVENAILDALADIKKDVDIKYKRLAQLIMDVKVDKHELKKIMREVKDENRN